MLCTLSLHIFKKSFTITEITRRIFQFSFQLHIQYLHTFMGSHVMPIYKSVSSDCMEGMPDINNTIPPYCVSFRSCVPNTKSVCQLLLVSANQTFPKVSQFQLKFYNRYLLTISNFVCCRLILDFMAQETISGLCWQFVSLP